MSKTTASMLDGRLATAGLCLAVAMIHVTDQGGFRAFADPNWLGVGYRALEVGSAVVALLVLSDLLTPQLTALALLGVGASPLIGFVLTRTVGLPQDTGDKGNWSDPLGIMSLVVEATLILVALARLAGSAEPVPA
ncbi:MAG: hypothetical protein JWP74_929 [Marmoricola sp.]|nr:hypothetical protein [Marmoricola sp.]